MTDKSRTFQTTETQREMITAMKHGKDCQCKICKTHPDLKRLNDDQRESKLSEILGAATIS